MSNTYVFETINNQECVRYNGIYSTNGVFLFREEPYFTMIQTESTTGGYYKARKYLVSSDSDYVTKYDIKSMLTSGVRVDLIVDSKIILPLTKINDYYAYFDNGELSLKVGGDGDVTVNNES